MTSPGAIVDFDIASLLDGPEHIEAFLREAFEGNDPAEMAAALGVAARAAGMTSVATETGLAREALYRSLTAGGNPTLDTVVRICGALGVQLTITAKAAA